MPRQRPHLKRLRFTMIELMAVITIMAILLTMTMTIMKTDSTKANATTIGGALSFAQAHAMANLDSTEYAIVVKNAGSDTLYIYSVDTADNSTEFIDEKKFTGNCDVSTTVNGTTCVNYAFAPNGDPYTGNASSLTYDESGDTVTFTGQSIIKLETITVQDNSDSSKNFTVYLKPFTGKIAYYPAN